MIHLIWIYEYNIINSVCGSISAAKNGIQRTKCHEVYVLGVVGGSKG